ncbi:MAG: hypothetical protein CVU72_02215 [Deltaproteobacteria bacterium HGW-Deltaproteobacteria-7]|jgi:hypothetical protein|nr:MAG: hypothetical protein CVU72_02215 [Deltaproteobacteria bacterium HGW-Deltaproteobacteria-7]PKN20957.1 MAG: hypothetical protein CVU71_04050 [Deltaproteobacteria bacterium HGW-Deltaproteobacteria-6]
MTGTYRGSVLISLIYFIITVARDRRTFINQNAEESVPMMLTKNIKTPGSFITTGIKVEACANRPFISA